jgi:SAM-dependent methyltransferase
MSIDQVYAVFYRCPRLAAEELSDGGGPFGFDVTAALEFDLLVEHYRCDAIFETGCNLGDTTFYLARRYPEIPLFSCDISERHAAFTRQRLAFSPTATVEHLDSPELIERHAHRFERPIFYLDAHWYEDWPLQRELDLIDRGIVIVDDFDIGHPRFGFDAYGDQTCGPAMLAQAMKGRVAKFYTNNPDAQFPLPCLQTGRRAGRAYLVLPPLEDKLHISRWFLPRGMKIDP